MHALQFPPYQTEVKKIELAHYLPLLVDAASDA
jgi:hypothetical protein